MPRLGRPVSAAALLLVASFPLRAQVPAGRSSVTGRITSADGRPLPGARVVRFGAADTSRADSSGRFAVERLPLGRHIFVVRQPGYQQIEMEVTFSNDTTITIDIPLESASASAGAKLDRVGFTERRRTAPSGGHDDPTFLGPDEISSKGAERTMQLLDGVRGTTIRVDRQVPVVFGPDGRCIMYVWLDGQRIDNVFPPMGAVGMTGGRGALGGRSTYTGLDQLIRLADVVAIEIYPRAGRTPAQFQVAATSQMATGRAYETRSAECGAIVIWSTQLQ